MTICSLIRQNDTRVLPDRQEIFLSSPDQVVTLLTVSVQPSDFRERLDAAVRRKGRKRVLGEGVTEGALSKILSGAVENPGVFTVLAICERAGVTLGSLLGESGYEFTEEDRHLLRQFVTWATRRFDAPPLDDGRHTSVSTYTRTSSEPATDKPAIPLLDAGGLGPMDRSPGGPSNAQRRKPQQRRAAAEHERIKKKR